MGYTYIVKRSDQISEVEKEQIKNLFIEVFGPRNYDFDSRFLSTYSGYSYHAMKCKDESIVGSWSFIPYKYRFFNKEVNVALSVDTMLHKLHHKDPFSMYKMFESAKPLLINDKIGFVMGFPNLNSYEYTARVLKWKQLTNLDYYILPINFGSLIKGFNFLNPFSKFISYYKVNRSKSPINTKFHYNVEKINDDKFKKQRYNSKIHNQIVLKEGAEFCYTVYEEENGQKVAYLIDVCPLEPRYFDIAVSEVYKLEKDNVDLIIYVGKLKFKPNKLFKVPKRFEPRPIRMMGTIVSDSCGVDNRILDINNWNVNISNFDVR